MQVCGQEVQFPKLSAYTYHVAIGPFGRAPVRTDKAKAEQDAKALGKGAEVRSLLAAQALELMAKDAKRFHQLREQLVPVRKH